MTISPFSHLLGGRFNFLRPSLDEMESLFPDAARMLPSPYPIYLEDESATPLYGFPVLVGPAITSLRESLDQVLAVEEEVQLAALRREPFPRTDYNQAWDRYRSLLVQAMENCTQASYGRHFPAVFWLFHSLDVASRFKDLPKRILRLDLELGRRHGDRIKYRAYENYVERARAAALEVTQRLADSVEEAKEERFPHLLGRMFDNVLIFTEDHVSSDLAELGSYFSGHLKIDGREMRHRFTRLVDWHARRIADDRELRSLTAHLLQVDPQTPPRELINRPGYVSHLASRQDYDEAMLLPANLVRLWEELLIKLKEFEVLAALRGLVLPVRREEDGLVFRAGGLDRTWVGQRLIHLSPSTRPLDFMAPMVIDPVVHRYGLIYDVSEFSRTVALLHRSGSDPQEHAFRLMFRFQRRINRLAVSYRLQLEKYLGDGAFYTSRHPLSALLCAVHLQRLYRRALKDGLPFDRGLRIGLNFGRYRLFPIQIGEAGEPDRYEFFGQGVVELTRLTSGKSSQDIEEIKNSLVNHGYPRQTVLRFFEPLAERNLDLVDKEQEARPFYAYINRNGHLINEGIVATEEYVAELDEKIRDFLLYSGQQGGRRYVVIPFEDGDSRLYVGLRRLGVAHLKGLEDLTVYEVIDGSDLEGPLEDLYEEGLLSACDLLAAAGLAQPAAD